MQTNKINTYSLSYLQAKTYLVSLCFVAGNILLPQLCHAVPQGGLILLPIYFFTLIAAYKYGWRVGLLTAVLSPLANSMAFGMPVVAMLPIIISKGVILAITASVVAKHLKSHSLLSFAMVVAIYQILGTLIEWAMVKDFFTAVQDFRLGLPGMMIQIFGGYYFVKYLIHK